MSPPDGGNLSNMPELEYVSTGTFRDLFMTAIRAFDELKSLQSDCELRWPTERSGMSYSQYAMENTRLAGQRFSFNEFGFQRAIMDDLSDDLTVVKISQVGITETQLRKALIFLRRHSHTTVLYTFPDDDMREKVSQTRVRPMFDEKNSIFDTPGGIKRVALYQIGKSWLHMSGMTEGDATSTPGDMVMHDEYDLSDPDIVAQFPSRLQNSKHKITQRFGTPTFPNFGVDQRFLLSDQRYYFVKCSACGHHQVPEYDWKHITVPGLPSVVRDTPIMKLTSEMFLEHQAAFAAAHFCCEKCGSDLREDIATDDRREWVAKHPARIARGYQILPSSTSKMPASYLFGRMKDALIAGTRPAYRKVVNTALGRAYSDSASEITLDAIKRCLGDPSIPEPSASRVYALGMDMGMVCHLVLIDITDLFKPVPCYFAQIHSSVVTAELEKLKAKYNIICGAVDRYPYTPMAIEIQQASYNTIVPVHYRPPGNGPDVKYIEPDSYTPGYAQCNRTQAIDDTKAFIDHASSRMIGYGDLKETLMAHLNDSVRVEEDEKPAVWKKKTGKDHFLHALTLGFLASKIRSAIDDYDVGGRALSNNVMVGFGLATTEPAKVTSLLPAAQSGLFRR